MARQRKQQPDWFTSTNPDELLRAAFPELGHDHWIFQNSPYSPTVLRRLQLVGCACARLTWELLTTEARNGISVRERYAHGWAGEADLRACAPRPPMLAMTAQQHAAMSAAHAVGHQLAEARSSPAPCSPLEAALSAAKALATRAAGSAPPRGRAEAAWHAAWNAAYAQARAQQAELVRDIFPPPGYTPALKHEWLTDTVKTLARHADDTGEYSALPILADALQDAGCDDEFILNRCRAESGLHSRGNWVVDLLLGRE